MRIKTLAVAGTLESSDVLVTVEPLEQEELIYDIQSVVLKQFGESIRLTVEEVLREFKVTSGYIKIQDRGALDCTLRARIETALLRSEGKNE